MPSPSQKVTAPPTFATISRAAEVGQAVEALVSEDVGHLNRCQENRLLEVRILSAQPRICVTAS
jgi:hypothetical protein